MEPGLTVDGVMQLIGGLKGSERLILAPDDGDHITGADRDIESLICSVLRHRGEFLLCRTDDSAASKCAISASEDPEAFAGVLTALAKGEEAWYSGIEWTDARMPLSTSVRQAAVIGLALGTGAWIYRVIERGEADWPLLLAFALAAATFMAALAYGLKIGEYRKR